ncbi:hypothetical protein BDY19DRAFT_994874 [Irpex rosettiformis]|uniref:Uncharacterized protein n=1 Tax=Irpex rosettiformis TaxID=378272 RepID=A0ACB8TZU6_9APHY|nr:hypothetical protein BDY19DRAFT_994874 [Irpex rosettiformis]
MTPLSWAVAAIASVLVHIAQVHASVTIYNNNGMQQQPVGTDTAAGATATNSSIPQWLADMPAFNSIVLQAPAIPSPAPPNQFTLNLQGSTANVPGISIKQNGTFLGFSIEMSVATQVIGINSTFLQVPFLNLMALLAQRGGTVPVRVGGNTQEFATLVGSIADGKALEKDKEDTSNPTATPNLVFTSEIIYMLNNVSALVGVKWYLGIPFNDTSNLRLGIAEAGEAILGDNLLGFQLGNEPDLYVNHGHRPQGWNQTNYFEEFGAVIQAIANDVNIPVRNNLIAPSVSGAWTPESVFDTGFIPAYTGSLGFLAVEHYPDNNCAAAFPGSTSAAPVVPQDVFPNYLSHNAGNSIVSAYLDTSSIALQAGKPFIMFETNTASCGGFPGVSDSFGAALWGVDYGMVMAFNNFSQALVHVGGVSDTYNPFTPPPTNISTSKQWTIGPIFYSTIVIAEALGPTGTAQVFDLGANGNNIYTPGYAIYENGNLARVLLVNFVTDASGASTYTATLSFAGGNVPGSVSVKYLLAPSVSEKDNITWAGQTFGSKFESDGRLRGNETISTVQCDQGAGTCAIQVPAPAVALVFLTSSALQDVSPSSTQTFSTTAVTKVGHSATIDATALATSNGNTGADRQKLSSTSKGSSGASSMMPAVPTAAVLIVTGAASLLLTLGLSH